MKVYIAGPLGSAKGAEARVEEAMRVGAALMDAGHAPLIPHLLWYMNKRFPRDHSDWARVDLEWLPASQALLRLPGDSPGADEEVRAARSLNIPVFYSLESLLAWSEKIGL